MIEHQLREAAINLDASEGNQKISRIRYADQRTSRPLSPSVMAPNISNPDPENIEENINFNFS